MDLHADCRLSGSLDTKRTFRVLVVDDAAAVHGDFRKILTPDDPEQNLETLEADLFGAEISRRQITAEVRFEVDSAYQGEAAADLVLAAQRHGQPYSVAFVDMRMPPGINGLETILKLWRSDPFLQVVICSAYSDQSWADIAENLGVSDSWFILRKPFDAIEVLQVAHALCRKWLLAQHARARVDELERAVRERTQDLERKRNELEAEVDQRKKAEAELFQMATHDSLTGIPNRQLLRERLEEALSRARRRQGIVAALFLDLDHFKEVNDVYGHAAGDQLLCAAAARLRTAVRAFDTVARMGGDEFVLLLEELNEPEEAAIVAERVLHKFRAPFSVAGQEVYVQPSIGIAICPNDRQDGDGLLKSADVAMYEAKESGRGTFRFYATAMLASSQEKLRLRGQLIHALARGQFRLLYQPLVELESSSVCGFEALVRWEHPEEGLISPARFVPIAEKSGLIIELGTWVLNTACRQLKIWHDTGREDLRMAVNVSVRELQAPGFFERVRGAVEAAGIPPSTLELELTETVAMKDPRASIELLQRLHEFGVRLVIDDFGAGHSSLTRVKQIPISVLKIDRFFIKDITTSPRDAAIVRGVVAMAHALGLTVVAEGVETAEQLAMLRELPPDTVPNTRCDRFQGYLVSRPVMPEDAGILLKRESTMSTASSECIERRSVPSSGVQDSSFPV